MCLLYGRTHPKWITHCNASHTCGIALSRARHPTQHSNTNAQFLFGFSAFDWRFKFLLCTSLCVFFNRSKVHRHYYTAMHGTSSTRWKKRIIVQFNRNIVACKSKKNKEISSYGMRWNETLTTIRFERERIGINAYNTIGMWTFDCSYSIFIFTSTHIRISRLFCTDLLLTLRESFVYGELRNRKTLIIKIKTFNDRYAFRWNERRPS